MNTVWEQRQVPWNGVGVGTTQAQSVEEAMAISQLDWEVKTQPMTDVFGNVIPDWQEVMRMDNHNPLGIVKGRYSTIQNREAFSFIDYMLQDGATFERAGCYHGGEMTWMSIKLPSRQIAGEPFDLYAFIMTGHDGNHSLFAAFTTIRAWCCNMAHLVSKNAHYKFTISHKGNVEGKMEEAKQVLIHADNYYNGLEDTAQMLRQIKLDKAKAKKMIDSLVPINEDKMSENQIINLQHRREHMAYIFLEAPDLQNEDMNGWRFINAVSDYETHFVPSRFSDNYSENRLIHLVTENSLVNKAYDMIVA